MRAKSLKGKKRITKLEASMIAGAVKSGMSVNVLNDLKELQRAKSKALRAIRF